MGNRPTGTCVIATTDFFMPVVDDPHDFGRIVATNAISDVYAMGGTPIFALAILGMPLGKLPIEVARDILAAQASRLRWLPVILRVAGMATRSTRWNPFTRLAVIGTARPEQIQAATPASARPGDTLILTKALGVGVYANALRNEALDAAGYAEMLA